MSSMFSVPFKWLDLSNVSDKVVTFLWMSCFYIIKLDIQTQTHRVISRGVP